MQKGSRAYFKHCAAGYSLPLLVRMLGDDLPASRFHVGLRSTRVHACNLDTSDVPHALLLLALDMRLLYILNIPVLFLVVIVWIADER